MITDEVTSDDPSELSESRIETQSESEVSFADAYLFFIFSAKKFTWERLVAFRILASLAGRLVVYVVQCQLF